MFEGRSLVHSPCRRKDYRQTFIHDDAKVWRSPEEMRYLIRFEEPIARRLSDLETSIRIVSRGMLTIVMLNEAMPTILA